VKERYRISTPQMSYEGAIVVRSAEPHGKEQKGRQWYVALNEMPSDMAGISPTEEGRNMLMLQRSASNFLKDWHERLTTMQTASHVNCYLATLDPAERDKARAKIVALVGMTATGGAEKSAIEKCLPGYAAFTRGEFVQLDPGFWAPSDQLRARALPACRQVFHTTTGMPRGMIKTDPNKIGYWSVSDDRVRIRHTVQFQLLSLAEIVEAQALLECPESTLDPTKTPNWRLVGIDLTNVRVQPKMDQPGPGGPPAFGGPGMGP